MNANEYGVLFEFGTDFDMSSDTGVGLVFTRPDGTVLTVTNPAVTVGSVDTGSPPNVFLAHQYLKYTFASGDINQSGVYSVRATYTDATPAHLISNPATFPVGP